MTSEIIIRTNGCAQDGGCAPFGESAVPIYAAMLTGKDPSRVLFASNSIGSFLQQTYPNRYLIIVNDGQFRYRCPDIPAERIIEVVPGSKLLVGELRNLALDYVPGGAVWIQWDDDDWHHPECMSAQYSHLTRRGLEACTLAGQVKYTMRNNMAWEHRLPAGLPGFAGTVMVKGSVKARYPAMQKDEDSVYWGRVLKEYRSDAVDLPDHYYVRFIHGNNSSGHLDISGSKCNEWRLKGESDAYLRKILPLYKIDAAAIESRLLSDAGPSVYA